MSETHRKRYSPGRAQGWTEQTGPHPTCHPEGWWCNTSIPLKPPVMPRTAGWDWNLLWWSKEVEILAKFSSMSLFSPLSHLKSRMKMTASKFPGILRKKHWVSDYTCLFPYMFVPNAKIFLGYKIESLRAVLLSQYWDRKALNCLSVYHMHRRSTLLSKW